MSNEHLIIDDRTLILVGIAKDETKSKIRKYVENLVSNRDLNGCVESIDRSKQFAKVVYVRMKEPFIMKEVLEMNLERPKLSKKLDELKI